MAWGYPYYYGYHKPSNYSYSSEPYKLRAIRKEKKKYEQKRNAYNKERNKIDGHYERIHEKIMRNTKLSSVQKKSMLLKYRKFFIEKKKRLGPLIERMEKKIENAENKYQNAQNEYKANKASLSGGGSGKPYKLRVLLREQRKYEQKNTKLTDEYERIVEKILMSPRLSKSQKRSKIEKLKKKAHPIKI